MELSVHTLAYALGAMLFWTVFAIIEIGMFRDLAFNVPAE